MIKLIQRTLRPLLIVVFIIIAISFTFFTPVPISERNRPMGANLGKIDGQKVTVEQFRDAESSVYALLALRYGSQIPDNSEFRRQVQIETWQRLLLLASASKIGLLTSDEQVSGHIRSMPALQKDGVYQPDRYVGMINFFKQSMGISDLRFAEIIRDELTIERMQKLIVAPVQMPAAQVDSQFNRIFGPATLATVTFSIKNYTPQVKTTPQEIENTYKLESETSPALRTKERRRVSFVHLPAATKADPANQEARRKAGEKALEFALALEPEPDAAPDAKRADFAATAQKFNLAVATTALFASGEPAAPLPPSPSLQRAAFALTNERPTSTVIETDNGFYILKLEEISPSKPRPLAEVGTELEEQINNRKALALLQKAGEGTLQKLKAEMAKGTSFRAAAAQLTLTVETLPTFVPGDPKLGNDPKLALARRLAMGLQTGELSPFVPTAAGGLIACLESRGTPDRKAYGDQALRLQEELLSQARINALNEWVRWRSTSKATALPAALATSDAQN